MSNLLNEFASQIGRASKAAGRDRVGMGSVQGCPLLLLYYSVASNETILMASFYEETLLNRIASALRLVCVSDMTFVHEGNKTSVDGLVNFEKMHMLAQTMRTLRYCRSRHLGKAFTEV